MLTEQQAKCLHFIEDYIHDHGGVSPTLYEMMEPLEVASKGSVFRVLKELEQRGFIRRHPKQARSIEVIAHVAATESMSLRRAASDIIAHVGQDATAGHVCSLPAAMVLALAEAL